MAPPPRLPPRGDMIARLAVASPVLDAEDPTFLFHPRDLFAAPGVRVEFARVPPDGRLASYGDDNAIVMRLVPSSSSSEKMEEEGGGGSVVRVMCLHPGRNGVDQETAARYEDGEAWFEVRPWSTSSNSSRDEFYLVLGRIYHVLDRPSGAFLFDVRPPAVRDVAEVRRRGVGSYDIGLHRMMLGSE